MNHRIALCHEWTTTWGGSEVVASRICEALGVRDVFSFAVDERTAARGFPGRSVVASRLGRTSFGRAHWQWLLPVMSSWWRGLDLKAFDAVVTSSHAVVNAVRPRADALLVSYCHTPMRYAWMPESEAGRIPRALRPAYPAAAAFLRRTDRARSDRVDLFIANSHHVQERIRRFYNRHSIVVHPPVDTTFFTPTGEVRENFFLCAGRFVAYKALDVAVAAATAAGVRLVVAGDGPELEHLRAVAGPTVGFRIAPTNEELRDLYRRARALVNPGVEDFGIVMLEAQACGLPVIAYARGGATEAVRAGVTGVLYKDGSPGGLADVLRRFDDGAFDHETIRAFAERFGVARFESEIRDIVSMLVDTDPHDRPAVVAELTSRDQ